MTAEELLVLPDDEMRHELVRGRLGTMPPNGGVHGRDGARLATCLGAHILAHQLGELFLAGTGFLIGRNPDSVRAPDFAFVRSDRWPTTGAPKGFVTTV